MKNSSPTPSPPPQQRQADFGNNSISRSGASKFAVLPDAAVLTHVEPLGHPEPYQDAGFDR